MSALPEDKRREDMLRELELLPVWRQRDVAPVLQVAAAEQTTAAAPSNVGAAVSQSKPGPQSEPALNTADTHAAATEQGSAPAALVIDRAEESAPLLVSAEDSSAEALFAEARPAETSLQVAEPHVPTPTAAVVAIADDDQIEVSPGATAPAVITPQAQADYAGDEHAAEREYYAASPTAWMEYAESVEPDWYSQEELAAATPDRRAEIMGMSWQALQQNVAGCQACQLHSTRTQTVFGVGDPQAEWLLVGEAPGAEEDRRGEPFVGQAGKLLDNMLAAIQLKRGENVYIANVLKCRPPANRDPQGEEVQQCDPYLKRQVELIKPKLIVALGKFAAQSLLQSEGSIASLRGGLHDFHGVPVIVTYHPAYLLRNLPDKARAWEDLCFARDTMRGLQSQQAAPSSL